MKMEYGYRELTEQERDRVPKGAEICSGGVWGGSGLVGCSASSKYQYRIPIDPGEGFEIVPLDAVFTNPSDWEFTCDVVHWCPIGDTECGGLTVCVAINDVRLYKGVKAFRRKKVVAQERKIEKVAKRFYITHPNNLTTIEGVQMEAEELAKKNPGCSYVILEAVEEITEKREIVRKPF